MPSEHPLREFSKSLPMALMRAREAVMSEFRPILNDHGLSEQQWRVLRALAADSDGISVGELADRTFLLGPSLSRIIASMTDRGLVTKEAVEGDGRKSIIQLAPGGMKVFAEVAPESEARYWEIERTFGSNQLGELQNLLESLVVACEPSNLTEG